ncbi:L-aspartate dehydrogenase [Methylobacterium bullatum]|uniref:L-aspartate dehydrogenase n=1 Tax=Methylobacterium bullatum TaxID=570505 RepID=A0A679IZA2_9HYPH|nr:L-aspartate dehydrogenase [Methylobacterium bullatum]
MSLLSNLSAARPDRRRPLRIALVADPRATGNGHRLQATGAFGPLDMSIENQALPANPKFSELTALALVRIIENQRAALAL